MTKKGLFLIVVPLLSLWLLSGTAWARSPWQQNIPPERVVIYHDVTNEYCGEGASWRDTITVWNVGALGGSQYEGAVWSYSDCEDGVVVSYQRDDGVFQGGPNGAITFPPRSESEIQVGWVLEDGKTASFGPGGGFEPWIVQNPQAFDAFYTTAAPPQSSTPGASGGLPVAVILVVLVGAGGGVVVGGAIVVKVVAGAFKRPSAPPGRPPSPQPSDPEAAEAIRAWQQAAQQADQEAEKYVRQWEKARQSGDPNDPAYQALEKKYQDYIQEQRRQAAEARREAQEIDAQEQQYQQEVRQQRAYQQGRQREAGWLAQDRLRQAERSRLEVQQYQQRIEAINQKYIDARNKRWEDWRDYLSLQAAHQQQMGAIYDNIVTQLEWVEYGADFVIETYAEYNPGAGIILRDTYKMTKNVAVGASESYQDPKNWKAHMTRGAIKGFLDVAHDHLDDQIPFPKVKGSWMRSGGKISVFKAKAKIATETDLGVSLSPHSNVKQRLFKKIDAMPNQEVEEIPLQAYHTIKRMLPKGGMGPTYPPNII